MTRGEVGAARQGDRQHDLERERAEVESRGGPFGQVTRLWADARGAHGDEPRDQSEGPEERHRRETQRPIAEVERKRHHPAPRLLTPRHQPVPQERELHHHLQLLRVDGGHRENARVRRRDGIRGEVDPAVRGQTDRHPPLDQTAAVRDASVRVTYERAVDARGDRVRAVIGDLAEGRSRAGAPRLLAVHAVHRLVDEKHRRARDRGPRGEAAVQVGTVPQERAVRTEREDQSHRGHQVGREPGGEESDAEVPEPLEEQLLQHGVLGGGVPVRSDLRAPRGARAGVRATRRIAAALRALIGEHPTTRQTRWGV